MDDADDSLWTVRAAWIFPIVGPPLKNGAVTTCRGKIVAVEETPSRPVDEERRRSALLPGLVNAHTHLEFSELTQPLGKPQGRFADWIGEVIAYRAARSEGAAEGAIDRGLGEMADAGIALAGEITTADEPTTLRSASHSPEVVTFREILGLAADRENDLFAAAERHLALADQRDARRYAGFSPHAPYTVRFDLVGRLVDLAAAQGIPVAMHLAETAEELELLASHSGPLVDFLRQRGFWRPDAVPRGVRPIDYLEILARAPRALIIHGTFLVDEEVAFLAQRSDRMSVVYCPRTHARLVGGDSPLEDFLPAGVRVALGTDSRASNPDLSLWNEVLFVRKRYPAIDPERLLAMATIEGAKALGLDDLFGTIEPGKTASMTAIDLSADDDPAAADDPPWNALFAEGVRPRRYVPELPQ